MLAHATNIPLIVVYFFALLVLAFLVRKIITWEPFTAGSGISEVRGEVQGYFDMDWIKVLIGKFIGCLLTMAGGLSLGREGPSVQLGAMAGKGLSRVTHRGKKAEHYLITCGASAGLSAASVEHPRRSFAGAHGHGGVGRLTAYADGRAGEGVGVRSFPGHVPAMCPWIHGGQIAARRLS